VEDIGETCSRIMRGVNTKEDSRGGQNDIGRKTGMEKSNAIEGCKKKRGRLGQRDTRESGGFLNKWEAGCPKEKTPLGRAGRLKRIRGTFP